MENTLTQQPEVELTPSQLSQHSSNTLKIAIAGLLILLPVVAGVGYYLGQQKVDHKLRHQQLPVL